MDWFIKEVKGKRKVATKSKGKILENQVVFDFFEEIEEVKPIKIKKQNKDEIKSEKELKPIKFNHIKRNRKVKKLLGVK